MNIHRPGSRLRDRRSRRVHLLEFLLSVVMLVACGWKYALGVEAGYPSKPILLVVTVPPGGAADFVARLIGAKLADALGQPVVIANRSGAAGTTAAASVAKAEPDGYTLLQNAISTHGIGPHFYAKLPYDPTKDFEPVILLAKLPLIMTVAASLPAHSVQDVVTLAKAQPGQLSFASSGTGGAPHLSGELFKSLTATDILHVPYRGSGPAVIDLIAGRTSIMFDAAPSLWPFITSGQLRPLATASPDRHPLLPDVPSFWELGYPQMDVSLWYGIVAPAGTPQPIVQRLNHELARILDRADIRKSFADQGAVAPEGSPESFAAFMRADSARWGEVIKQAGITAQ